MSLEMRTCSAGVVPPCLRLSNISFTLTFLPKPGLGRIDWGEFMSKRILAGAAIFLALSSFAARAADLKDMIGTWRWQQFTIEVTACQGDGICAKVIQGPKNVGMEVFATKLTAKDGKLFGQISHRETKDIYNTRFQQDDADKWSLDGCTVTRVCLSGEFVRVK
jgi:hypothetical protein